MRERLRLRKGGVKKQKYMCLDIDVTFLRSLDQRGSKKHFSKGGERLLTTKQMEAKAPFRAKCLC